MTASPAKTAALYTVAGLAAGHAIGHPKFGAALGLGLGLRAPRPGQRLFDQRGDPRALSKAALGALPGQFSSSDWRSWFGANRSTRLRQGDLARSPYAKAPTVARSIDEAKLAAAYAFKFGKGSNKSLAVLQESGPWASQRSVTSVIDAALKSGIDRDARAYLIGVRLRSKGVATPGISTRGRYRSPKPSAPRAASPIPRPAPIFSAPIDPESRPGAPSSMAAPWYKTRGVLIGAGVLGGTLLLALVFGGRKR